MAGAGPMHWRGDRTGGSSGGSPLDEDLAFKAFNPAFVGLLGRATQLTPAEMQNKQAVLETSQGRIVLDLLPDAAPNHVAHSMPSEVSSTVR